MMGVATDVSPSVQRLRDALRDVPQGPIDNIDLVLSLLKGCWNELMGSNDTSMRDFKVDRAEQFSWRTPSLSFTIERHGATVVGSTRAELQNWTVNLDSASAYHSEGRFRQLVRQAPRLDVKSIVARVCDAVQQGPRSECDLVRKGIVFWSSEGEVIIKHGALVPGDGYRQTVAGRRRRFRQELAAKMSERGWKLRRVQRSMTFVRASVNEPPPASM
jgi:hypothetical protein